jgi:hypothetical protein
LPVAHDPIAAHASSSSAPAAAKIAPQTPPPLRSAALAALTIASTVSSVMSPRAASIVTLEILPGFTEPTPLSDILHLFRYRRVEVSASGVLPAKK